MIFLITGTPGAGKSLNAIKFVDSDPIFKDRPVYYFNIKDCQMSWNQLTADDAKQWFNLPEGSVIILDEAYDLFPSRLTGKPPEHVEKLAVHRHRGYDIVLICQKVKGQLDSFIRGLVGRHMHFERRFGTQFVTRYEWQKCCEDVGNYHERKAAAVKQIKLDKKYFDAYKSAEVHTVKPNLPWKALLALPILIVACVYLFSTVFTGFIGDESKPDPAGSALDTVLAGYGDSQINHDDWISANTPRIEGFPHTAPIYDDVTKPKTFPKPQCVLWVEVDECRCYTQQATRIDTPPAVCRAIIANGWFDPTRQDGQEEGAARRAAVSQPTSSPPTRSRLTYIKEGDWLLQRSNTDNSQNRPIF